jgi:hypothetical protein
MKSKNLLIILLLFVFLGYAQQGNYKFDNFGNRSILLAGNVTGSVSDLGLTYYNPSFLAEVENVGFSLNAKAYQLVSYKLDNVLNENTKLSNTRFNGASTMAGGVFNLFGTRFAYSYLTKSNYNTDLNYNSYYLNDNILSLFPDAESHNAKIGLTSKVKDDWTGLAWAHKVTENFSLGISAFASIYSYRSGSNISHTVLSANSDVAFYQNTISFNQKSYGLFLKIGANYHFPKFDIGVNVNLPYLEIYEDGRFSYSAVVAGVNPEYNKFVDNNFKELKAKRKEPLGISIGAGIPINKSKLHLNLDYVSGLGQYDRLVIPDLDTGESSLTPVAFDEKRQAVINLGFGIEFFLTEQLQGYGGFSTDFNAFEDNANILDLSAEENKDVTLSGDFYHMSLGVDWKLKWASVIAGLTYTSSSGSFANPYSFDTEVFNNDSNVDANLKYTRWQFVVGIDIPILSKKINSLK